MSRLSNIQLILVFGLLIVGIAVVKLYDSETMDWAVTSKYYDLNKAHLIHIPATEAPERNAVVISSNAGSWQHVKYSLPSNASFEAVRNGTGWKMDTVSTDSTRTWAFLNRLDTVYGSMFIDKVPETVLINPEYVLEILDSAGNTIKVECFVRTNYYLMRSSQNPGNIFDGQVDSLFNKVFVGRAGFSPKVLK